MRIAIFTESYWPVVNGVSTSVEIFMRELEKLSQELFIFAPRYPGYEDKRDNVIRVPSYRVPGYRDYPLAYPVIPRLRERFATGRFDLVHTQSPFTLGMVGARLARQFGLPLVTTSHTVYPEYAHYMPLIPRPITRRGIIWRMRTYCNGADYVIAPSRSIEDMLVRFGVTKPIRMVPTGPTPPKDLTRDPEFPRKRFGIPESAQIIMYAGRIAREKNLELLLDAFELIVPQEKNAHLLLVGDGPHEQPIRALARKKRLDGRVTFTGFVSRELVSKCFADAAIFAFPSYTDAQGLVVSEAMAHGVAPVAVNAYGPAEWVKHEERGLLCSTDPRNMADCLLRLLRDRPLRERLAAAARDYALRYSASRCAEMMLEVYREAVGAKRA